MSKVGEGVFIIFVLKVLLLSFLTVVPAFALTPSEQVVLSNQVQNFLKVDTEIVDTDKVKFLSEKIINNRQHYSNNILAKVYLLSARVASDAGNINKAFEYAQEGVAVNSIDKKINLALLLELADVYIANKDYQSLLALAQVAVKKSEVSNSIKYQLLSLSYRSVAFALLGKHKQALTDLQKVEQGISSSELTEHIELLTILALAYHHLGDYQTSRIMQLKILKLSVEMGRKRNIAQIYLYLGYAYMHLLRLDDAYNAFWQSKKYAENMKGFIHIAHANKGLGIILIKQKQYHEAFSPLQQSIEIFSKKNMQADLIESSVALASAKLKIDQSIEGYALLTEVIKLLDGKDISLRYAGFYRMVAEMHFAKKNYQVAYRWGKKHSEILIDKLDMNKISSSISPDLSQLFSSQETQVEPIEESKKLAVKLAESSELSISFVGKYQKQRFIIISLAALICLLLITFVGIFLRLRADKINLAYEEIEKPSYVMASPVKTKFDYQLAFKKARGFQYPLTVGYLVIDNWQELTFHFNNKTMNEVTKDIASVINEQITEFDYAGLLNDGEYLLLFEHQNNQDVSVKIDKLLQAVNSRAFASLGGFSVSMKSCVNTPNFKDIDPYLFLARIAESVNIYPSNMKKQDSAGIKNIFTQGFD